jgi:hypothetical protein
MARLVGVPLGSSLDARPVRGRAYPSNRMRTTRPGVPWTST